MKKINSSGPNESREMQQVNQSHTIFRSNIKRNQTHPHPQPKSYNDYNSESCTHSSYMDASTSRNENQSAKLLLRNGGGGRSEHQRIEDYAL